jgi:PKD repeat protein
VHRRRFVALACLTACGGNGASPEDAGLALDAPAVIADAAPPRDGSPVWVDFAVSGCALIVDGGGNGGDGDAGVADAAAAAPLRCRGPAPLTVAFAAIVPGPVDTFAWTFGDGTESDQPAPAHTYLRPGRYDVAVSVAGAGGTATAARAAFVEVTGAALGAACTDDDQCTAGTCLCAGEDCPPGLAAGLCTAACGASCAGGVCAVLGGGGGAPWAGAWCLAPCSGDDCAPGRECEVVASAGGGWVDACLPAGALASLGASCAGAGGPDDARCASGDCLAIGARGACSLPCGPTAPCPDGARCASFGNGTRACVAACDGDDACGSDPWLACEAPGAPGAWGFTLDGDATVCAPRRCTGPDDCPGGACTGGHCAAD